MVFRVGKVAPKSEAAATIAGPSRTPVQRRRIWSVLKRILPPVVLALLIAASAGYWLAVEGGLIDRPAQREIRRTINADVGHKAGNRVVDTGRLSVDATRV